MFSASLVQLGTTRNYIAVEEKFLGFVLVYELVCTELHGSGSFVKRVDPFCAINRHDCVLRLGCHSVCPHCKHLDTFEFLCMVQVKRNIVLHNRKLKAEGWIWFSLHLVVGKRYLTVSGAFSLIKTNLNPHTLYWLPVELRIVYRIYFLTFKCVHGLGPKYLQELLDGLQV